jgi:GntR family transcriptional regulator
MPRFCVDPRGELSPSDQIAEQVRSAIASAALAPGDRLPSVRVMAAEIVVNPNTVAKAYRQLEWEGVVEPRAGDGVFVAAAARVQCVKHCHRVLKRRLDRWVDEARRAGLTEPEMTRWFEAHVSKMSALAREERKP